MESIVLDVLISLIQIAICLMVILGWYTNSKTNKRLDALISFPKRKELAAKIAALDGHTATATEDSNTIWYWSGAKGTTPDMSFEEAQNIYNRVVAEKHDAECSLNRLMDSAVDYSMDNLYINNVPDSIYRYGYTPGKGVTELPSKRKKPTSKKKGKSNVRTK